jgi:hypothetical protein
MGLSNVKDLLGHELEPYSMAVEKGKIKELADVLGETLICTLPAEFQVPFSI